MIGSQEGSDGGVACHESYVLDVPECDALRTSDEILHARDRDVFSPTTAGEQCCPLIREHYKQLVSNGVYIMRPNTSLTREWLDNIEYHLDLKYDLIMTNPAPYQRCCNGIHTSYPIRWAELHGEAFHPLQFKYRDHIAMGLPRWAFGEYKGEGESNSWRK